MYLVRITLSLQSLSFLKLVQFFQPTAASPLQTLVHLAQPILLLQDGIRFPAQNQIAVGPAPMSSTLIQAM